MQDAGSSGDDGSSSVSDFESDESVLDDASMDLEPIKNDFRSPELTQSPAEDLDLSAADASELQSKHSQSPQKSPLDNALQSPAFAVTDGRADSGRPRSEAPELSGEPETESSSVSFTAADPKSTQEESFVTASSGDWGPEPSSEVKSEVPASGLRSHRTTLNDLRSPLSLNSRMSKGSTHQYNSDRSTSSHPRIRSPSEVPQDPDVFPDTSVAFTPAQSRIEPGASEKAPKIATGKHRRHVTLTELPIKSTFESMSEQNQHKRRSTGSLVSIANTDVSRKSSFLLNPGPSSSKSKDARRKRRSAGSIPIAPIQETCTPVQEERDRSLSRIFDGVIPLHPAQAQPDGEPHIIHRRRAASQKTEPELLHTTMEGNNVTIFNYSHGAIHAAIKNTGQPQFYTTPPVEQLERTVGTDEQTTRIAVVSWRMPVRVMRIGLHKAKNTPIFTLLPWFFVLALSWLILHQPGDGAYGTGGYPDDNWLTRSTQSGRDRFREWVDIRPDIAT